MKYVNGAKQQKVAVDGEWEEVTGHVNHARGNLLTVP